MAITICLINESSVVTETDLQNYAAAQQLQLRGEVANFYAIAARANVTVVPDTSHVKKGNWVVWIRDDSDQPGALGYHDIDPNLNPIGFVFARTDLKYGLNWTVTASHEIIEMVGDQWAGYEYQWGNTSTFGTFELCDPVEADALGYNTHGGIWLSDFVTPAWFFGGPGPYSYRGSVTAPRTLAAGGYMALWTPSQGWHQRFADSEPGVTSRRIAHAGDTSRFSRFLAWKNEAF
jgi:hypothetical protein